MQAIKFFIEYKPELEEYMAGKKEENFVFSYTSGDSIPSHFFDKKGQFTGNVNKNNDGILRIQLEKNSRGGKTVTTIFGFDEKADLQEICSELKKKAGSGGTVKEGKIEIQGDKRDIAETYLISKNFKVKRAGG